MKVAFFTLVAAGFVAAQDFSGQPECAIACLEENIPKVDCKLDDTGCQCNPATQSKLRGIIAPCLLSNCNPPDLLQAQTAAQQACAAFASTGSGLTIQTSTPSASATESESATGSESSETGSVTETSSVTETESVTETVSQSASVTETDSSSVTGSESVTETESSSSTETEESSSTTGGTASTSPAEDAAGAGPTIGAMAAIIAAAMIL
jgi:hypothetical protein